MEAVSLLPSHGDVFFDERDAGRTLRVAYHPELAQFVVSLWRDAQCRATFRLPAADTPRLVETLTAALADAARERPLTDVG